MTASRVDRLNPYSSCTMEALEVAYRVEAQRLKVIETLLRMQKPAPGDAVRAQAAAKAERVLLRQQTQDALTDIRAELRRRKGADLSGGIVSGPT